MLCRFALIATLCACSAAGDDLCTSGSLNATATPDVTQGPYHITEVPELFRSNVTEGQPGVPLQLEMSVLSTACEPLTNVLVEVWCANALGYYSGVIGQSPGPGEDVSDGSNEYTTLLRGVIAVDSSGVAVIQTNLPGRYTGRAPHIHYAVHIPTIDSTSESAAWNSSYLSHVGQVFFEDSINYAAHECWPYSETSNTSDSITLLAEDNVWSPTQDANLIADFTQSSDDICQGGVATIQAIVDVSSVEQFMGDYVTGTNLTSSSGGGGMGGQPGGAGGPVTGGVGGSGAGAGGPKPSGTVPALPGAATSTATSVAGRRRMLGLSSALRR